MWVELVFAAELCRVGKELNYLKKKTACAVHGDYEELGKKIYVLDCGRPELGQIEARGNKAIILDPVTREVKTHCMVDTQALAKLIATYSEHARPEKCRLEKITGQMSFTSEKAHGRCSFRMNRREYDQFLQITGKKPSYQCENERFLILHNTDESEIYFRGTLECRAHLHTSSEGPVQDPASYYQPAEPTFIP